jgi:quercetin dioxygenase-like cupin family protein
MRREHRVMGNFTKIKMSKQDHFMDIQPKMKAVALMPKQTIEPHYHIKNEQTIVCCYGEVNYVLKNRKSGAFQKGKLVEGESLTLPPQVVHGFKACHRWPTFLIFKNSYENDGGDVYVERIN